MLQNFYNTTFFHKDGSPKFVRVYYDKRFSIDPYTAIFTKTANMLDGYHRVALIMNSFGDYYHGEIPPRTYPGKPCAWKSLPEGIAARGLVMQTSAGVDEKKYAEIYGEDVPDWC